MREVIKRRRDSVYDLAARECFAITIAIGESSTRGYSPFLDWIKALFAANDGPCSRHSRQ